MRWCWPLGMRYATRLTGLGLGAQIREEAPALGATAVMVVVLLATQPIFRSYLSPWIAAAAFGATGVIAYVSVLALIARADLIALYELFKKFGVFLSSGGGLKAQAGDSVSAAAE